MEEKTQDEQKHWLIDAPNEVVWVIMIQGMKQPVGLKTWEEMKRIIDKYPEHFPWEHLYNSIQQEVHDAYRDDIQPGWREPLVWAKKTEDPTPIILRSNYTDKELMDMIDEFLADKDIEEEKYYQDKKRKKTFWKKHYGKYKLEYRD